MKKKAPLGIKILAIIYFASVLFSLIIAGLFFFYPSVFTNIPGYTLENTSSINIPLGIFMIIFAGMAFFIAKGILKGKNVARIALGVISTINILGGLSSVIKGDYLSFVNISFNLIVILYIIFPKRVKKHFQKRQTAPTHR